MGYFLFVIAMFWLLVGAFSVLCQFLFLIIAKKQMPSRYKKIFWPLYGGMLLLLVWAVWAGN